jgi:hypothetical protein
MPAPTSPTARPVTLRRRLLALVAATTLAGAWAAVPSTASAADCDPEQAQNATSVDSVGVVVGTTKTKTMELDVHTLAGCSDVVVATVDDPRGVEQLLLTKVATMPGGYDHWRATLAIKPSTLENSDAGPWPIRYTVVLGAVAQRVDIEAQVQRAARISFNAGPEPVRGDRITYSGTLERANWDHRRYQAWRNHPVQVELSVPGEHDVEPLLTVRTDARGHYRASQRYRGDGNYQSHSSPSITTQMAYSRVDAVVAAR